MKMICEMNEADIDSVLEIQTENGLSVWNHLDYKQEINREDSICKVAKSESDTIEGFAIVRLLRSADGKIFDSAEINNIAVRKSFQKKGIGQKLFDEIVRDLRKHKVSEVWLEVRKSNTNAIRFYQKNGFTKQFERKNYYQNPLEDACIFKLLLDYEN